MDLARGQAAESGVRIEVPELRSVLSSTYANPDGTLTDELSSAPVWAPTAGGGWVPVDPTLEATDAGLRPRAAVGDVTISAGGDNGDGVADLVRVVPSPQGDAGDVSVTVGVDGPLPVPVVDGATARYVGAAAGGSDVVVSMSRVGPQVSIVIRDPGAAQESYALDLAVTGLEARVGESGTVELVAADGTVAGTLSAPVMFDSTPSPSGLPARQVPVAAELVDRDGGQRLVLTPDRQFLDDPATRFPVTIDPSVNLTPSLDTPEVQNAPTTNYDSNPSLVTGWNGFGGIVRSYIKFSTASIAYKNVTAASLNLWQAASNAGSCATSALNVYDSAALSAGSTWNTKPTMSTTVSGTANTTGDSVSCPAAVGWKSVGITGLAQTWAASGGTAKTLGIRSGETTGSSTGKTFDSADGTHVPYLAVTYYTTPPTPTAVAPANNAVIDTLAPTVKATAGTQEWGATWTTTFTIKDVTGATVGTKAKVGSGVQTWAVDPDLVKLRPNSVYTLEVKTCTSLGPLCSATVTNTFTVNPALGAGDRPYFQYESFPISDRANLKVNVASGNLVIANNDLTVAGTGPAYTLARTFNSTTGEDRQFGHKWTASYATSERLARNADGTLSYWGPTGTVSLITPKTGGGWNVSGDVDAELIDLVSYGTFVMRFHHARAGRSAGDQVVFYNNTSSARDGLMGSLVDLYGNTVDTTWVGTGTEVDEAVDTQARPFEYTYTSGRVTTINDPNGSRDVDYSYDGNGDLRTFTDANGAVTSYDSYDAAHNPHTITGPAGNVINLDFDAQNRVIEVDQIIDAVATPTTFDYYDTVNLGGNYYTEVTNPRTYATTYDYDNANRVVLATDALGATQASSYDDNSNVDTVTDGANNVTTSSWSTANNLDSRQQATGATESFTYNSTSGTNPIAQYQTNVATNPQARTATFGYSSDGAPLSTTNQLSSQNTSSVTRHGINSITCGAQYGQVCTSIDPRGKTTSFGYDSVGNLTDVTPPTGLGAVEIDYDAVSRVSHVLDGNGTDIDYTYDDLDRVTEVLYNSTDDIDYVYDANGNVEQRTDLDNSVWTYTYDERNLLTSGAGPNENVDYSYDEVGNLVDLDDSSGSHTYTFTAVNMLETATNPANDTTTYTYDTPYHPMWRTKVTYDTGVEMRIDQDNSGRTESIEAFNTNTMPETKLTSFAYTYDNAVQNNDGGGDDTALRSTVTNISGDVTTYGYDAADRLLSALTDPTVGVNVLREWAYDGAGNVTQRKTNTVVNQTFTYNDANQLTSGGAGYDANGNLTTSSAYGYTGASYNDANQTTSLTPNGGSAQALTYAGQSQDHLRTIDSTQYESAGNLGIVGITNTSDTTLTMREPSGTLIDIYYNGNIYNYLYDGQGNVVGLTDNTGNLVNTYTYDPYGRRLAATETFPNPFQYAGGYTNTNGTTYKYGTRWYDTTTLAWTQPDPAGQSATYTYVDGNPVNRADPSGRTFLDISFTVGPLTFGTDTNEDSSTWWYGGSTITPSLGLSVTWNTGEAIKGDICYAATAIIAIGVTGGYCAEGGWYIGGGFGFDLGLSSTRS